MIDYMASLGSYYKECYLSYRINHRGKGHNKQAHKNNYKQKRKGKRK